MRALLRSSLNQRQTLHKLLFTALLLSLSTTSAEATHRISVSGNAFYRADESGYYGFQIGYEKLRWWDMHHGLEYERAYGDDSIHFNRYHARVGYTFGLCLPFPITLTPIAALDYYDQHAEKAHIFAGSVGMRAAAIIIPGMEYGLNVRILKPFHIDLKNFTREKRNPQMDIEAPIRFYIPFLHLCDIGIVPFFRTEKFGKGTNLNSWDIGARIELSICL